MSLRRPVAIAAAACLAAAAIPAAAHGASVGGASPDVNPDGTSTGAALAIGTPVATSSSGGITITSKGAALLKRRAVVSGLAPTRLDSVSIEALDRRGVWSAVGSGEVEDDGSFRAAWKPRALGLQSVRAVPATSSSAASRSTATGPQVQVTVYRPGVASWYSPATNGGSKTACGVRLTQWTIGVAHKTLPCGTQVEIYYGGKKLVVPVIDRGPFIDGRSWDLTKATHDAIGGKDGLITVGALTVTTVPKLKTPFQAPAVG
ncbi:septal ring lytic transglycosylase RlpA family protein [Conexibacter sp. JD483]|uniref:septal ring lytic transglycosylase RlpA family protein n=1 Tax=unclassified Conexibacter TaxID=2627773 RepID=UPI00271FC06E|nr:MULTISPECIES: septal ring lytic transglycosylase RlpA family protein [unclassified Conexibacter]MDO8186707.1 septal ring lytic transglycosylase RlpA family protein [Conexibacter sp. CPCC 205706]MDO8198993.1 septal ring lytic transglycosylase RlpA family protein [Conexibacter sp. CPCC 205762]MDR9368445.1 septal ring lytic transglycosylase RlpA family protein [Conexibacter sp. JD483]